MKKLSVVLWLLLFFSCHNEKKNNGNANLKTHPLTKIKQGKTALTYPAKKDTAPALTKDTTAYEPGEPEITPLPFGFKPDLRNFRITESYFIAMLSQNKSDKLYHHGEPPLLPKKIIYKLPPIKSIEYIPLPVFGLIDTGVCIDGKPFGNYINLKEYQYRLPDVYSYQCYYKGGFHDLVHDNEYSRNVFQNCAVFISDYEYGYFILYNPKTLTAKVLTIYFDSEYDELVTYRFFYIDRALNICVYDGSIDPALGSKPKYFSLTTISILPNGEVKIKKH